MRRSPGGVFSIRVFDSEEKYERRSKWTAFGRLKETASDARFNVTDPSYGVDHPLFVVVCGLRWNSMLGLRTWRNRVRLCSRRNLMRDIQVDGAPMVHPAPGSQSRQGPLFWHLRTPELMPQKILGAWGQRPLISPCSTTHAGSPPSRLASRAKFPASPSAASVSLGIHEPVTFTGRFQNMAAMG